MRILLINPPFNRLKGLKEFYLPIGLGYLAAVLNKAGHDAKIYSMDAPKKNEKVARYKDKYAMEVKSHKLYAAGINNKSHIVWQELRDVLARLNPNIVALTASSAKFQSAIKVAETFKEFKKDGIVILGGPHATICPDESIKNKFVDFLVRGEGENTIAELCAFIEGKINDASKIDGLSYKRKGKIIHNKERELIKNLDNVPFPARKSVIFKKRYPPSMFGVVVTMRGCPFRCTFCAAKCMWGLKVRARGVDNVVEEIKEVIKDFGTKEFFFWDDSFTINRKRTIELCHAIIKKKLNIAWGCSTKVTLLDEELVKTMKKAGCSSIELGVETGSERMLKLIKKDITIAQVRKATELLKKHRISFTLMLMAGFPQETKKDIEDTVRFIEDTEAGFFCFSVFTPYPGTELYDTARSMELLPAEIEWAKLSHHSPDNYFAKHIPKEDFKKYVKKINNLVDKHNKSLRRKWEFVNARLGFYIRNPVVFIKKAAEEIKRK